MTFYQGDAITVMKTLGDHTVNLIYTNPPFNGATKNKWDTVINWPDFFKEAFRLLTPNGTLILHCAVPFNYTLIRDAPRSPDYSWYWKKEGTTNPYIAKIQPLRCVEEILVWKGKGASYYPQRVGNEERTFTSNGNSTYYGYVYELKPQTVKGKYQTHFLNMKREIDGFSTRPKDMIRLIYDSYSKAGDTVLDPFCNNAVSSTCCPGRQWIGIDLFHEPTYLQQSVSLQQPVKINCEYTADCEIRNSTVHGKGVFAVNCIKKNTRLADYIGEEMSLKDFKEKYGADISCTYHLGRCNRIINGKQHDNLSHYMNESKTPNAVLKKRGVYAAEDIAAGDELFLQYPKNYIRTYKL